MSKSTFTRTETISEDISEQEMQINIEDISPLIPPDGGWSWMVLLGSVMCMFFVDGLSFSFGVLLSELQSSFECTKTQMSLAGSLIVGSTLISGPIVSALSNQFSMRSLVVVGGISSSLSILSCCFITNTITFIIMFGLVTGLGFGLIYLPAATVVSQWFHKRRATATGISMCGSSIGTTLYSLMIPRLVNRYTWRGCLAILSAVSLNCVVAGLLFIPLRNYQKLHPIKTEDELENRKNKTEIICNKEPGRCHNSVSDSFIGCRYANEDFSENFEKNLYRQKGDRPSHRVSNPPSPLKENNFETPNVTGDLTGDTATLPDKSAMGAIVSRTADQLNAYRQTERQSFQLASIPSINSLDEEIEENVSVDEKQIPLLSLTTVNRIVTEVLSTKEPNPNSKASSIQTDKYKPMPRRRTVSARQRSPTFCNVEPSADASIYIKRNNFGPNSLFASSVSLKPSSQYGVLVDKDTHEEIVKKLQKEIDKPVNKMDFFYSGSMIHVNQFLSTNSIDEYVRTVTKVVEENTGTSKLNQVCVMLRELFDITLFNSPTFILIITSSVFGLFGYPVPYVFLKDNAQTLGFSAEDSSYLLVYLSAVNTVGRVLAGVLSDRPCVDVLFVNNAALIISGVACVCVPFMTSYSGQVVFAVTYGLSIAAFVSLRIILLVEMMGLERLTNAFGFLLLFQGLAFMSSPPILAGFYDALQSFQYTFMFAGSSLIFSALICFPLRPILRWEKRRRGEIVNDIAGNGCFTHCLRLTRDRLTRHKEPKQEHSTAMCTINVTEFGDNGLPNSREKGS